MVENLERQILWWLLIFVSKGEDKPTTFPVQCLVCLTILQILLCVALDASEKGWSD